MHWHRHRHHTLTLDTISQLKFKCRCMRIQHSIDVSLSKHWEATDTTMRMKRIQLTHRKYRRSAHRRAKAHAQRTHIHIAIGPSCVRTVIILQQLASMQRRSRAERRASPQQRSNTAISHILSVCLGASHTYANTQRKLHSENNHNRRIHLRNQLIFPCTFATRAITACDSNLNISMTFFCFCFQ